MTIERKESFPPALVAAVVALLSVAVYSVTLGGTYVYDDFDVFALDACRGRNPRRRVNPCAPPAQPLRRKPFASAHIRLLSKLQ